MGITHFENCLWPLEQMGHHTFRKLFVAFEQNLNPPWLLLVSKTLFLTGVVNHIWSAQDMRFVQLVRPPSVHFHMS